MRSSSPGRPGHRQPGRWPPVYHHHPDLADTLAVRLGGRAAERLTCGEASTGAADNLVSATALATQMVREFGLSEAIGPVSYSGPPAAIPRWPAHAVTPSTPSGWSTRKSPPC